ncbi:MAG: hypothetical protein M3417_07360 [Actinomycetota bacterium]|nr:hypothetical protein [Actinomycetota bacterium]
MAVKDRAGSSTEPTADVIAAVSKARKSLDQVLAAVAERPGVTVAELAERAAVSEEALVAFAEAAGGLLAGRALDVTAARRAGLLAAAMPAWEDALGPMLTSAQVREILGGVTRQRVDELLRQGRLIGLQSINGRRHFPAFQFHDGQLPAASLATAFGRLADGALDPWSAGSWCVSPNDQLDGRSPAEWAAGEGDGDVLRRVAERDAARLSR